MVEGPRSRERRVAETREALKRAADDLFAAQGYGETTIEQIAERADVAPRTFFRYFPTKESVLFAEAEAWRGAALTALLARPAGEHPFASMVAVLAALADTISQDLPAIELRRRISEQHPSVAEYERTVLEGQAADAVAAFVAARLGVDERLDPRPRVWAVLAMSSFRVALHTWLEDGRRGTLGEAVDRALAAAAEATAALRQG